MRKQRARESSGKLRKYEITVMWKNEDSERGDAIIELDDNIIEVSNVSGAREYIESLPNKLGLGSGI